MKENKNRDRLKNFRLIASVSLLVFYVVIGASCSRHLSPNAEQLALGKPFTKQLKNDEIHSYTVKLEKNQFLSLSIEQHDVDVITKVFAPNDESLGEFDTPTSGRGTEQVRIGAETSGEYRVDIYTLSAGAEPGQYTLQQTALRPISELDRKILSAIKLHQEADRLRAKPEPDAHLFPFTNRLCKFGVKSESKRTRQTLCEQWVSLIKDWTNSKMPRSISGKP